MVSIPGTQCDSLNIITSKLRPDPYIRVWVPNYTLRININLLGTIDIVSNLDIQRDILVWRARVASHIVWATKNLRKLFLKGARLCETNLKKNVNFPIKLWKVIIPILSNTLQLHIYLIAILYNCTFTWLQYFTTAHLLDCNTW